MNAMLAYAPRRGPLGAARPWIAVVYLAPLAVIAFTFANPLVLLAAGTAAAGAGIAAGAGRSIAQPLRWSVGLAVMVVAVNAIASQRGDTVLFRGSELPVIGRIDITLEALAEGGVLALRILVALLVFAVWSACVDPDRVLRAVRPFAARSALTATLVSRLVPTAAADGARMAEAGRLRGPAAAPVGRAALVRRLVAGALDRSVDIAATLELRGYGLGIRSRLPRHRREPGEGALLAAGVAGLVAIALAAASGIASFDAYPRVAIELGPETLLFALAVPAFALAPLLPDVLRERRLRRG
ncbi:MAG TPA: energy-coupling factor transporter transmembrane component T [Solirubrobacterales bacterium]|jgi:energy-coupling factor transport system permease protein|nr:energy-coupling factor transporter transmembrane component T [Solirubrobacterales bacterium]